MKLFDLKMELKLQKNETDVVWLNFKLFDTSCSIDRIIDRCSY